MRTSFFVLISFLLVFVTACGSDDDEQVVAAEPSPTSAVPVEEEPTASATSTVEPETELSWEDVVELLEPSTVMIRADFPGTAVSYEGQGSGTGIVYSDDGYILTNSHVVTGAAALTVATAGSSKERSARFIGVSPCDDLAVIKVDDMDGLVPATLGASGSERVGAEVAALGYPLGEMLSLDMSVSRGVVSKMDEALWNFQSLIQHDATINPGNSGGPLVNRKGEVIGVNTASVDPSQAANINFAISIDQAKPIIEELEAGKNRHWLGMNLEPNLYPDYFGTEEGLVVAAVASGSSASSVGVRAPYLLSHLQGLTVNSVEDVCRILRSHKDGDSIKVEFMNITETEVQYLEGEVVMGEANGGADIEIVHREIFSQENSGSSAQNDDTLTVGSWVGTATIEVDYWAPCGTNNDWTQYTSETFIKDVKVLIDVPFEGEDNPYWFEAWTEPMDAEEEGGFWLLSSWDYGDYGYSGELTEYWYADYNGIDVEAELIEVKGSDDEYGNVLYSNMPVDPCSDSQGFVMTALQMEPGALMVGELGSQSGYIEISGMTTDLSRDFFITMDLTRID